MPSQNVDLVFVIDASQSMRPCFDALRTHLDEVIQPMQGYVSKVRFGLVAQSVLSVSGQVTYDHRFLCGNGIEAIKKLYQKGPNDPDPRNEFFTDDPKQFAAAVAELRPQGNEEMLLALDVAADFPFGPLSNTKRVIALFSDECFEGGKSKGSLNSKIPALSKKLMGRHIQLFVAIPDSPAIQELAMVDRSEVELVDGGNGLKGVDFKQLLGQMGKSISGSSMQIIGEATYQRAIFGQDKWDENQIASKELREQSGNDGDIGGIEIKAKRLGVLLREDGNMGVFADYLRKRIQELFPEATIVNSSCTGDTLITKSDHVPLNGLGEFGSSAIAARDKPGAATEGSDQYYEYLDNYALDYLSLNFDALVNLVKEHQCDALLWLCELDSAGTKAAIGVLSDLLTVLNVKFYVRSRVNGPDAYPGLADLIRKSGGELKIGPFESRELLG